MAKSSLTSVGPDGPRVVIADDDEVVEVVEVPVDDGAAAGDGAAADDGAGDAADDDTTDDTTDDGTTDDTSGGDTDTDFAS